MKGMNKGFHEAHIASGVCLILRRNTTLRSQAPLSTCFSWLPPHCDWSGADATVRAREPQNTHLYRKECANPSPRHQRRELFPEQCQWNISAPSIHPGHHFSTWEGASSPLITQFLSLLLVGSFRVWVWDFLPLSLGLHLLCFALRVSFCFQTWIGSPADLYSHLSSVSRVTGMVPVAWRLLV